MMAAVVSLAATLARADDCPSFAEAAEISADQFYALTETRSIAYDEAFDLAGDDGAVRAYLALPSSPSDIGPRGMAYYVSTGAGVCLYHWSSAGTHGIYRLAADAAALQRLIDDTLRAVSDGAAPLERRARRRSDVPDPDPEPEQQAMRSARPLTRETSAPVDPAPLLRQLSDALFPEALRAEMEALSSLTVIPALNIGIVPFAGLDPDGDGRPLAETTSVNVEASVRDVLAGRIYGIGGGVAPQSITGDPDATADPEWIFPRLPGAAREALAIAERFGAVAVIGPDAVVGEVAPKMQSAEYIHVAAHGYSDPRDPIDGSFLALTGGRLTARTIQEMDFGKHPLVVLSACQTGLGGTLEAGVIGLARAFLFAGASSVVASLWNVDDAATEWIMTRFAENVAVHAPAEALRLAQQAGRERWPDPRIWASFIVFGSRTVSVAGAPDVAADLALAVEGEFELRRGDETPGERLDLSKRTHVMPGDTIYARLRNASNFVVDVTFVYLDAEQEPVPLESLRLQPGDDTEVGLVRITDSPAGDEMLVTSFREVFPRLPIREPPELRNLPPLARILTLVGVEAVGRLFPSRGITPVLALGPQPVGALVQAPLGNEAGPVRRALGVVSLRIGPAG